MMRHDAETLHEAADRVDSGEVMSIEAASHLLRVIADRWEITPSGVILAALEAAQTLHPGHA